MEIWVGKAWKTTKSNKLKSKKILVEAEKLKSFAGNRVNTFDVSLQTIRTVREEEGSETVTSIVGARDTTSQRSSAAERPPLSAGKANRNCGDKWTWRLGRCLVTVREAHEKG